MFQKILVLIATLPSALLLISGVSNAFDLAIEAEWANGLEAPLMVADDPNASGGQFLWTEGEPAIGGPNDGSGWADFNVTIPTAGTYAFWGKVIAWDGNSDSFWVTWQPADPDEDPQETGNTEFRWSVASGSEWHWDRNNQWLDGGTFERTYDLPAGETTLRIWTREDATMIDVIYITDDLSEDEAVVALRDPTDADRAVFTGEGDGTAVEAKDKMTTTWAQIKGARQ